MKRINLSVVAITLSMILMVTLILVLYYQQGLIDENANLKSDILKMTKKIEKLKDEIEDLESEKADLEDRLLNVEEYLGIEEPEPWNYQKRKLYFDPGK